MAFLNVLVIALLIFLVISLSYLVLRFLFIKAHCRQTCKICPTPIPTPLTQEELELRLRIVVGAFGEFIGDPNQIVKVEPLQEFGARASNPQNPNPPVDFFSEPNPAFAVSGRTLTLNGYNLNVKLRPGPLPPKSRNLRMGRFRDLDRTQ
jgi:hypothetical protein